MALAAEIIEFPFTTGQNEGTERAVLPMGQFSYLQNARFRKNQRLGKRNGYTAKSSLDSAAAPLGNGSGRLACLGPEFCVVDDRFYQRDTHGDAWRAPPASFDNGALAGTRLYGKFPQFMPAPAVETLTVQSDLDLGAYTGTAQDSLGGMTVALGYVWTCAAFFSATAATWLVRVTAMDPATGRMVWRKDVDPGGGTLIPATVRQQPVLLTTGNALTVVLIYDHFTAGAKDGVSVRVLTSLAGGFSAEVFFACLQSAANYDPFTPGGILFMYGTAALQQTVARMNPATMAATATLTRATASAPTALSVFGNASGLVWLGYTDVGGVFTRALTSALVDNGGGASWVAKFADAIGPILFASRDAVSVAALSGSSIATGRLNLMDLDAAASQSNRSSQFNCKALSQPFTIGAQVFIWARHAAGAQLGVATLLRVPLWSEYSNNNITPYVRSFPTEATLDDRDVDDSPAPGASGPLWPTPLPSSLGYVALIGYTRTSIVAAGATKLLRGFLLVPVRHRSEGLRYAPSCVVPCASKQFVAGAQPMWVDQLGEYEAGFVQAPVSTAVPIVTAGGALTANSRYFHTAVFECIDANGLIERSAPAIPVQSDTTGNTTVTVHFSNLELGMRVVRCKLYRTPANASVFYLVNSVDASPASAVTPDFTFVDVYADADIIQNEPLYIDVGQELAASNFPACSFANTGGNRLWCAGGFTGNVWQCSKQFAPHLAPEFADDDAFRGTLPADITGGAWLDSQVFFTQEGIYVISGEGPNGAGEGFFTTSRLPFNIGCIDWRSVAVADIGIFFQSARGLYLLPRGFGNPVPMDQVLDTLTTYPIITSARPDYNAQGGADNSEQIVQWTAVADEAATAGVTITFDLAYKAFSVDTCRADYPATFASGWLGDAVQAPALTTQGPGGAAKWHPFRVRDDGFDDAGLSIDMRGVTGDVRPWGAFAHGVVNRVGLLAELRAACELELRLTTDRGESHWKSRIYAAVTPDWVPGDVVYLEAPLGQPEQRDITSLRVSFHEDSTTEGVALFGLYIERQDNNQGWRGQGPRDRVNVLSNALITESGADVITDEDGEQLVTEEP